ncbi:hypothetical protein [Komagataeibacter diospyri]|uniref:hypothetical protein n=1 Tax=Komagataeibacter diospyri TaxID=1932662 RepID=UPI003756C8E1
MAAGTPARSAAEIIGINCNTATLFYRKIREIIARHNTLEASLAGEVEVDKSYFIRHRKDKRAWLLPERSPFPDFSSTVTTSTP